MPVIIKNGKVYGDRSVTISQAEYNLLSETEKNNGTTYYLYDVNSLVQANEVGLDGGNVRDLAGSVATIESSPAAAAHSIGDFILWNGTLYSVTAAIAVGETLAVGSNITATTTGEEIQALKNGLTNLVKSTSISGTSNGFGNINFSVSGRIIDWAVTSSSVSYTGLIQIGGNNFKTVNVADANALSLQKNVTITATIYYI